MARLLSSKREVLAYVLVGVYRKNLNGVFFAQNVLGCSPCTHSLETKGDRTLLVDDLFIGKGLYTWKSEHRKR